MANKKRGVKPSKEELSRMQLKAETWNTIIGIIFFVLALLLILASLHIAGPAGEAIYKILHYALGVGYVLLPTLLIMLGYAYVRKSGPKIGWVSGISSVFFLLSGLGIIEITSAQAGGLFGKFLSFPLVKLFDVYASIIFLGAVLIISILVMFDAKPDLVGMFERIRGMFTRQKKEAEEEEYDNEEEVDDSPLDTTEEEPVGMLAKMKNKISQPKITAPEVEEEIPIKKGRRILASNYVPPPLTLLEEDRGKPNTGDLKGNSNIIKRTLLNFGIEVEMDEITVGPTVTRYALKPAEGVKLSRILALQNDLALALAAHPIRIEAPIPGKSLVGIEIPNKSKSIVGLATMLRDSNYTHSPKPLTVALGRGLSGKATFGDLAKMPHCLVAGATGAGKSVTIHAIITSLLFRNGPDDMKFIMVDPKRVELTLYNKIPHLLTPVITDAKKAILALKWAAKEMDRRYDILEGESVRDIESYHLNVYEKRRKGDEENGPERLPYIVIIIDELADIMTAYPRELESAIVRLAQMSRAVGIHLILSTQRPEVNVITGLIKANIPARIALKVSSQIDSRTILDTGGAEKLLGAGDMLYSSGTAQPERIQSAFISENEVKNVVKFLAENYADEIMEELNLSGSNISADKSIFESSLEEEDDDELFEEARMCVLEAGKASTSYLQRKLKLGYARAARLMDALEERGVVGPADGAKPREVLIKMGGDSEYDEGENK